MSDYKTPAQAIRELENKIWAFEEHCRRWPCETLETEQYRLWVRMLKFLRKK